MKFVPRARIAPDAVLDGISTVVICLDAKLAIASINTAGESLFEVSRRHALGEPVELALPAFAPHLPRLREAAESGTGFIEHEMELPRAGAGEALMVDCTVTPILLGKGTGLVLECQPMERLLRISREELLLSQHQASRELIRGLAHEIKNPLGGIRGAAQLMEKDFPDSQHSEYTGVIIREADRLQNLVNRMLGPNRMPQKLAVNIHEVLEHVRQLVEAQNEPGISLIRDYDPSIPDIIADREQMIQSMLNIVGNAVQSISDGPSEEGAVTLRTRTKRQFTIGGLRHRLVIQIDIEDTGPGISPAIIDRIFYPMVTTRAQGTGLGLPMAQYLIHSHGGLIECRSRPGCTVFSIYMPLDGNIE
tara:strand:- start:9462 stop:10550 length:1089 start_codon:yes stop_codon:yes gene_type:complete